MDQCFNCFREKTGDACPHCGYDPASDAGKYPLALPHGSILAGQYVVGRVLGQGGFGITYVALDNRTGERAAIKEYFPDTLATRIGSHNVSAFTGQREENFSYGLQCFLSEAQVLASLMDVSNVVKIHSYFEENGTAYFVMDYVEGSSLDAYVRKRGGRLSWKETQRLLLPVMDALAVVHSRGIIHRDVTPDNIFITKDGTVKLLDFGAARYSLGDRSQSLDVVLKHGYAPKEQYTRRGKQGPYTDIYSLGATFYYCLTGHVPPESIDRMEEDELILPSSYGVWLPAEAEKALEKALAVQISKRYQSMEQFKEELTAGDSVFAEETIYSTDTATVHDNADGSEMNYDTVFGKETVIDTGAEPENPHNADTGTATFINTGTKTGENNYSAGDEAKGEESQEIKPQKKKSDRSAVAESQGKLRVKKLRFYAAGAVAVLLLLVGGSALVKKVTEQGGNAAGLKSSQEANANGQSDENAQTEGDESQGSGSSEDEGSQIDIDDLQIQDEEADCPWENNILMADRCVTQDVSQARKYTVFKMELIRDEITSITFLETLDDAPGDAIDFSEAQDGSVLGWTEGSSGGYDLYIAGEGGVMAPADCSGLFNGYENVTYIDFRGAFHTENSEKMSYMFSNCASLMNLDLSGFDTSGVGNMWQMFSRCSNLESLDLKGFDTSDVSNMGYIFNECNSLKSLDLSSFDTSNVKNMCYMFCRCDSLESLDLSGFDTSNVTDMSYMFSMWGSLESLDLSGFDTSNVTDMSYMFYASVWPAGLDVSGFDTSNVTDMSYMFSVCIVESLDLSGFDTSNVTNMYGMFENSSTLISLDLTDFDTSEVTEMGSMFSGCSSLESLDLSSFDTSKVIVMWNMFSGCSSLTSLEVSSFDTSKVTDMVCMFEDCSSLENLEVSGFDTSKVEYMSFMFANCPAVTIDDISDWDVSRVQAYNGFMDGTGWESLFE